MASDASLNKQTKRLEVVDFATGKPRVATGLSLPYHLSFCAQKGNETNQLVIWKHIKSLGRGSKG